MTASSFHPRWRSYSGDRDGDWTYATYFSMDGSGGAPVEPSKEGQSAGAKQSLPKPAYVEYELYNIKSDLIRRITGYTGRRPRI